MKVLHVSAGALYGGVERVLTTLAKQREPHFAVCFEGRLSSELRALNAPVHQLGEVRVSRPAGILTARAALHRLLAAQKFDVVITHLPWAHAIFAPVARAAGIPVVFWMHGFATGNARHRLHWTEMWARRTPPALVLCNSHATAATAQVIFPNARQKILYYPVEQTVPPPARDEPPLILQISRMESWKGHALLFAALALLPADVSWRCRIVGGAQRPEEATYLRELRAHPIAERVEFAGERSDVSAQLASADIFCQPNTGPEPFGIVFIEALAAGLPVVTTHLGAAPEIVDPTCGLLTPPGDAHSLARALTTLLRDAALRTRLGAAGTERARQLCDPDRQIALLYDALAAAIWQSRTSGAVPA